MLWFTGKKERKRNRKLAEAAKAQADVLEETIPAMVTIKRVTENGNSQPTVTITLKGSTPDQDKLLYTLVNGTETESKQIPQPETNNKSDKQRKTEAAAPATKKKTKKNKVEPPVQPQPSKNTNTPTIITKELKVTLALDPSNKKSENKKQNKVKNDVVTSASKPVRCNEKKEQEVNLPMLKLPPGKTFTFSKVNSNFAYFYYVFDYCILIAWLRYNDNESRRSDFEPNLQSNQPPGPASKFNNKRWKVRSDRRGHRKTYPTKLLVRSPGQEEKQT